MAFCFDSISRPRHALSLSPQNALTAQETRHMRKWRQREERRQECEGSREVGGLMRRTRRVLIREMRVDVATLWLGKQKYGRDVQLSCTWDTTLQTWSICLWQDGIVVKTAGMAEPDCPAWAPTWTLLHDLEENTWLHICEIGNWMVHKLPNVFLIEFWVII